MLDTIESESTELAFDYWNNEETEKEKPYYCIDQSGIQKMYSYVNSIGVYDDLKVLLAKYSVYGYGISLGAGYAGNRNY